MEGALQAGAALGPRTAAASLAHLVDARRRMEAAGDGTEAAIPPPPPEPAPAPPSAPAIEDASAEAAEPEAEVEGEPEAADAEAEAEADAEAAAEPEAEAEAGAEEPEPEEEEPAAATVEEDLVVLEAQLEAARLAKDFKLAKKLKERRDELEAEAKAASEAAGAEPEAEAEAAAEGESAAEGEEQPAMNGDAAAEEEDAPPPPPPPGVEDDAPPPPPPPVDAEDEEAPKIADSAALTESSDSAGLVGMSTMSMAASSAGSLDAPEDGGDDAGNLMSFPNVHQKDGYLLFRRVVAPAPRDSLHPPVLMPWYIPVPARRAKLAAHQDGAAQSCPRSSTAQGAVQAVLQARACGRARRAARVGASAQQDAGAARRPSGARDAISIGRRASRVQ